MIEQFRKIITDYVEIDPMTITEETSLRSDLGVNSYELMNLIVTVEDTFGVEIPDREFVTFQTVGDLIAYIEKNRK